MYLHGYNEQSTMNKLNTCMKTCVRCCQTPTNTWNWSIRHPVTENSLCIICRQTPTNIRYWGHSAPCHKDIPCAKKFQFSLHVVILHTLRHAHVETHQCWIFYTDTAPCASNTCGFIGLGLEPGLQKALVSTVLHCCKA